MITADSENMSTGNWLEALKRECFCHMKVFTQKQNNNIKNESYITWFVPRYVLCT